VSAIVRPACVEDHATISGIDASASAFPWSASQIMESLEAEKEQTRVIVVDYDSKVVGFVVYQCVLDQGSIHNIAIDPRCQRQGLASKLLCEALRRMKDQGMESCLLEVRQSNEPAAALYASLNFQVDGLRKNYYRGHAGREDAILMSKRL